MCMQNYVNEVFDGTLHRVSNWAPPVERVRNFSQLGFSAGRNPEQVWETAGNGKVELGQPDHMKHV